MDENEPVISEVGTYPTAEDLNAVEADVKIAEATAGESEVSSPGQQEPSVDAPAVDETPPQEEPPQAEAAKSAPMCRCGANLEPKSLAPSYNYECPGVSCRLRWMVTASGQECIGRGAIAT